MSLKYKYYRTKFKLAPYLPLGFPVHIDIELSGKCQLRCTMCAFGDNEDGTGSFDSSKQGMMSYQMAMHALIEARQYNALSVKLNFRGEPGLHKDLIYITQEAKDMGYVDVMLNTNLTAFSKRRLRELCEAGLDTLIVSVDGATKETYEAIRINGKWEKLLDNLFDLYLWKQNGDRVPKVVINMTVQDRNRGEVSMMKEKFKFLSDEIRFNNVRTDNVGERTRCPQPFQRLVVMWDGWVGACCSNWNNEAVIGKFPDQSLKEIWDSKERKELLHYAKDPNRGGPCKGCLVGGSYK